LRFENHEITKNEIKKFPIEKVHEKSMHSTNYN